MADTTISSLPSLKALSATNNALTPGRGAILYGDPEGKARLIIYNGA